MPDQVIRVTNGSSLVVRSGAILGVGPSGPIGPKGDKGDTGVPGTYLYTTATPPTASSYPNPPGKPRNGDLWLDPATGHIWQYSTSTLTWTDQVTSIKGPQGVQGVVGPTGPVGPIGPAGSAAGGFNTFNDILLVGDRHP
jgi:hypothetical protein